ncbi:DUF4190 domain-containing protein [Humibacter ginsenosidimutans]|uniref:DUF4190 domain-containing protein n=1 Tax=Humibacter ginsenosidimutans TaxID=2599293 RepID=UPI001AEF796E|nr:DUF4190 domain-containing protein [Humibacter ginsenosidimutans]
MSNPSDQVPPPVSGPGYPQQGAPVPPQNVGYPAPSAPAYQPAPGGGSQPGRVLGIVGLIVAFFFSVVGLILSIVAKVQSRKAGVPNGPATAGIIVGIVLLVLQIIVAVILIVVFANIFAQCADLGPGTHYVNGVTYTCS